MHYNLAFNHICVAFNFVIDNILIWKKDQFSCCRASWRFTVIYSFDIWLLFLHKQNQPGFSWTLVANKVYIYIYTGCPKNTLLDTVALFVIYGLFPIDWYQFEVRSAKVKDLRTVWNLNFWLGWVWLWILQYYRNSFRSKKS